MERFHTRTGPYTVATKRGSKAAPKKKRAQPRFNSFVSPFLLMPADWKPRPLRDGPEPAFEATDYQRGVVAVMSGIGKSQAQICAFIINPWTGNAISADTLTKHFHFELQNAGNLMEQNLVQSLVHNATVNGDTNAAKFLLKCRHKYREDDPPVATGDSARATLVVPVALTIEDWQKVSAEHAKSVAKMEAEAGSDEKKAA